MLYDVGDGYDTALSLEGNLKACVFEGVDPFGILLISGARIFCEDRGKLVLDGLTELAVCLIREYDACFWRGVGKRKAAESLYKQDKALCRK